MSDNIEAALLALMLVVGEHTRSFHETNVNIMKSIIQLFLACCEALQDAEKVLHQWMTAAATGVAVQKISDKKLSSSCKSLLTELCSVAPPHTVLLEAFQDLKSIKSPVAHEEFLRWLRTFCSDFGAFAIGSGLGDLCPPLLEVSDASHLKACCCSTLSCLIPSRCPGAGAC